MNEYKILGYTNPTKAICGPLVTIVEVSKRIGVIFPDLTFYYLDVSSINEIKDIIIEHSERYLNEMQYSYRSIDGKIYVLNENLMLTLMNLDYIALNKIGDEYLAAMIKDMIDAEYARMSNINPFVYLKNVNCISRDFKVYFTDRKRSNGTMAKRLIIQRFKNHKYKTYYKKNLRFSDLNDFDSCKKDYKRISYKLNRAMENIAERSKTKDFEGLLLLVSA